MPAQIKLDLSATAETRMCKFLRDKIRGLRDSLRDLHENRLPVWRRAYEAIPAESIRQFPWYGASNLVVPVIAIHSDTLLARVMSAVMKTDPLWVARLIGSYPKKTDDLKVAYEQFMQFVGLEPSELDLYRVYHEWFGEAIRYGTSVLKVPWVKTYEDVALPAGDGTKVHYMRDVKYEGPKPHKLPFNDFFMSPLFKTIEDADFKAHRIRYSRFRLEELGYRGVYDKAKAKEIIGHPTRTQPDNVMQLQATDAGAMIPLQDDKDGFEEYDVYECHYKYRVERGYYCKIIAWYNEENNKLLRAYYNYYPDEIFIAARLFYRDDFFYGYGFCETLGMFQEELSQIHNGRRDNVTVANTKIWRVEPDSLYQKGYRVFPGAMLPGKKDDIEALDAGQVSSMTIDEEHLSLDLAEKRSGVSGPTQGMGSGMMSKRGVYSSAGTLSLLQEGNTRTDLNITDIRYAHTKVGRVLSQEFAEFGPGNDRVRRFGMDAEKIKKAFELIQSGSINLPITAATASINREVEKQSDLMLTGVMQKHHQMVGQMLQAASNQFSPPEMKKYLFEAIDAANTLMKSVFRHFGYDEVDKFVPAVEQAPPAPQPGQPQLSPGQPQPQGQPQEAPQPQQEAGGLIASMAGRPM
jgi:hypothetical protein